MGTGFNRRYRGMWAEFYDSLFNLTRALFQLFITLPSCQVMSDALFCLVVVKHLSSRLNKGNSHSFYNSTLVYLA